MGRTMWVGAVAYDPKVVTIWEGTRRYFHEEASLAVEVVLFQSYAAQVSALLATPSSKTMDGFGRSECGRGAKNSYRVITEAGT